MCIIEKGERGERRVEGRGREGKGEEKGGKRGGGGQFDLHPAGGFALNVLLPYSRFCSRAANSFQ